MKRRPGWKPSGMMTDNASTGAFPIVRFSSLRSSHTVAMTNSFAWDDLVLPASNDVSTAATSVSMRRD